MPLQDLVFCTGRKGCLNSSKPCSVSQHLSHEAVFSCDTFNFCIWHKITVEKPYAHKFRESLKETNGKELGQQRKEEKQWKKGGGEEIYFYCCGYFFHKKFSNSQSSASVMCCIMHVTSASLQIHHGIANWHHRTTMEGGDFKSLSEKECDVLTTVPIHFVVFF